MFNTLYLEKRGCDFWKDDQEMQENSDCQNYRICGWIIDKYGRDLFVEFGAGTCWRRTNKRTGAPLKKMVAEHRHALRIDTCFSNKSGSYRDLELEKAVHDAGLEYTTNGILEAVRILNGGKIEYNNVIICDVLPEEATAGRLVAAAGASLEKMNRAAGWRERYALENMETFSTNKQDQTVTIYYNGGAGSVLWSKARGEFVG